jgi:hypothetical protein
MMFDALSFEDIAILEEAIEEALDLAEERGIEVEVDHLAAKLSEVFVQGERNPKRLADAAVGPPRVLQ